jgi:hypothetical protein
VSERCDEVEGANVVLNPATLDDLLAKNSKGKELGLLRISATFDATPGIVTQRSIDLSSKMFKSRNLPEHVVWATGRVEH